MLLIEKKKSRADCDSHPHSHSDANLSLTQTHNHIGSCSTCEALQAAFLTAFWQPWTSWSIPLSQLWHFHQPHLMKTRITGTDKTTPFIDLHFYWRNISVYIKGCSTGKKRHLKLEFPVYFLQYGTKFVFAISKHHVHLMIDEQQLHKNNYFKRNHQTVLYLSSNLSPHLLCMC